ncbi:MAG: 2-C-methyl-D-erythritol 4-phosphate cytidylyltransferase, partial [Desulfurivibrionaceae bacterium]
MTTAAAIIPAGGAGLRMGLDLPKQYLELAGLPVLVHTVRARCSPGATMIMVLIREDRCKARTVWTRTGKPA